VVRAVISSLSFPTDAETEGESRYAVASPDRIATGSRGDTRRRLLDDEVEEVEYALLRKVEPGRCDKREGPPRAVERNSAPVLRILMLRCDELDGQNGGKRVRASVPATFILCPSPSPCCARCAVEKSTVSDGPHGRAPTRSTGLPLPPKIAYGPGGCPENTARRRWPPGVSAEASSCGVWRR
jgi:hypothetical protein